jgi:RNA polymerase sigma factor (sigma-70 family)
MDDGFDEFVHQNLTFLARYAHVLTGDRHAAEDLLQDTLLRVGLAWPRVRQDGRPLGYAKTAMVRIYVSRLRRMHRRARLAAIADPDGASEDTSLVRIEHQDLLRPALNSLSPLQRAVIVLSYFDDADDEAIAGMVHRRRSTVRSVRRRALRSLRERLTAWPDAATHRTTGTATSTEVQP